MFASTLGFARRAMLALALALASTAALAGPVFHFTLDTSGYSGAGWLDLQFNPGFDAAPGTAVLSNFSGALGAGADVQGSVGGALPGTLQFTSDTAFNAYFREVALGGMFSFDIEFEGEGSLFSVGLYGSDQVSALGNGDPFTNSLAQVVSGSTPQVFDEGLVQAGIATPVPEPSSALMLALGLAVLAAMRRRWHS